jgi:signal transduction histidine kinase/FixJ family two-component response regulator
MERIPKRRTASATRPILADEAQFLVLVVDDQLTTTQMLRHVFEREGCRVEVAYDGVTGLEYARRFEPDLILLDVLMPRMSGFEVLHHLRQDPMTINIPCILITANAQEPTDVVRGITLGADDYLRKPFAPQELLARAQSKMRAYRLEQALHQRTRELETLLYVSEVLNQHLEANEQIERILQILAEMMPDGFALVQRVNTYNGSADLRVAGTIDEAQGELLLAEVLARLEHAAPDRRGWQGEIDLVRADLERPSYHSIAFALEVRGEGLGTLMVGRQAGPFSELERSLIEGIAAQSAAALYNAQLYQLRANIAQQLEARVAERTEALKSAHTLLIRSEKLASIGHLAASIAHEINNPLMPIQNLLEEMVDDLRHHQVSYDEKGVQIIQESIERIRGIVSRLLEFARDSGHEMKVLDVRALLESIIHLNHKSLQNHHVAVALRCTQLAPIYGSKDQLEQVFMNLTLNAQAAMTGAGGVLTIEAVQVADKVVIKFRDTGCGIPEANLGRIFDPFFSTKPNGTGLGLFVSFGIIQAHHGTIEVHSQVNTGTTFRIMLPVYAEAADDA